MLTRIVASILAFFGAAEAVPAEATPYRLADVYLGLRSQALALTAERLHTTADVFGILMETGYEKAAVSLVALTDGTTSLYFSSGGGIIGAGPHPEVAEAATRFLAEGKRNVALLSPTKSTPVPNKGRTRFYLLTGHGLLTAEAPEDDLGNNRHALSGLFHAGQAVVTEIRLTEAKKK